MKCRTWVSVSRSGQLMIPGLRNPARVPGCDIPDPERAWEQGNKNRDSRNWNLRLKKELTGPRKTIDVMAPRNENQMKLDAGLNTMT